MVAAIAAQGQDGRDERIREILDALVRERHGLVDPVEREANRLAIAYWRQQLGRSKAAPSSTVAPPKG